MSTLDSLRLAPARGAGANGVPMNYALLVLVATLAVSGSALAGVDAHIAATLDGETHTVDLVIHDDGSYSLLVDGQPVGAPEVPSAPEVPAAPALP